jgi:hypothetical protein
MHDPLGDVGHSCDDAAHAFNPVRWTRHVSGKQAKSALTNSWEDVLFGSKRKKTRLEECHIRAVETVPTHDIVSLVGPIFLSVLLDDVKRRAAGKDAPIVGPLECLFKRAFTLLRANATHCQFSDNTG